MNVRTRWREVRRLVAEILAVSPRGASLAATLIVIGGLTEGAGLLLLAPLLELVGVLEESPLPRAASWLESGLATIGVAPTLGPVLAVFVGIAAARTILQRSQVRVLTEVREDLINAFRLRLYRAMAAAEWRFLVTRTPAEFAQALTGEVTRVGQAVTRLTELAGVLVVSAVYLALAFRLSAPMAVVVLACGAVLALLGRGAVDRARAAGARAAAARSRMFLAIAEHLASIKSARSYGALSRHAAEFEALSISTHESSVELSAGESNLQQRLDLGSHVLLAAVVYAAISYLDISGPLLLVLLFLFARLMPRLVQTYRLLQALATDLPVFDSVLRLEQECLAAAEAPIRSPRAIALNRGVAFEDVSFQYLRRTEPALHRLHLDIEAGLTTAVVGPSGSGKTTVADLLMGLLTPTSGALLVDGVPLSQETLESWRSQIGYVSQDSFLLHDTVRANLAWARVDATDADMWEALRLSSAAGFVEDLPNGLDTVVGERGVLLSGGERQRLSIARALVRRPRMLVFDEATSSLDLENEGRIQQAIDGLQHRMTIVIIAHRLSTIRHADVIHVMEGGRVVQSGTWDSLLADRSGRFHALVHTPEGDSIHEIA